MAQTAFGQVTTYFSTSVRGIQERTASSGGRITSYFTSGERKSEDLIGSLRSNPLLRRSLDSRMSGLLDNTMKLGVSASLTSRRSLDSEMSEPQTNTPGVVWYDLRGDVKASARPAILNYSYRIYPSPAQEATLGRLLHLRRRWWNMLLAIQRWASRQKARRASLESVYLRLISGKKPTGQRVPALAKAHKRATYFAYHALHANLPTHVFIGFLALIEHQGSAFNANKAISVRKMGWYAFYTELASELGVYRKERKWGNAESPLWWKTVDAFKNETALILKKRGRLRFQKKGQSDWLRAQVTGNMALRKCYVGGDWVNLGVFLNGEGKVKATIHRPLPSDAVVKQIHVSRNNLGEWRVALSISTIEASHLLFPPAGGRSCGVDPGRKTAYTITPSDSVDYGTSDGFELKPAKPMRRVNRRIVRLQRRLDRQRRANNPHAYDKLGRFIKGATLITSNNMEKTRLQMASSQARMAYRREAYYQLAARELLQTFDTVYIGNWSPSSPQAKAIQKENRKEKKRAKGAAAQARGANKADALNAPALFRRILIEKAARSSSPKKIIEVNESGTTRTCPHCMADSGPTGLRGLARRVWTCTSCHTTFDRDRASAWNIAKVGRKQEAAVAQAVAEKKVTSNPMPARTRSRAQTTPLGVVEQEGNGASRAASHSLGADSVASAAVLAQVPKVAKAAPRTCRRGEPKKSSSDASSKKRTPRTTIRKIGVCHF